MSTAAVTTEMDYIMLYSAKAALLHIRQNFQFEAISTCKTTLYIKPGKDPCAWKIFKGLMIQT